MSMAHDHRYRYLDEYRGGIDLFYCEVCLEYRAVKRDDQPVMLGQRPEEEPV
jgi:hypothetical protein